MSTSTASSLDPRSRRLRRITRVVAAAWLALFLGLTTGLGSCTAVLNLDDYGNVVDQMCTLLDRCYPAKETAGCLGSLAKSLDGATSDVRAKWLDTVTSFGCLDSCSDGRHCLDIPPLCTAAGACARRQDCCGFLEGNATCLGEQCCATRGSKCDDNQPCCLGAGACSQGVCGGVACLASRRDCATDDQCCTKICKRGLCADTICEDDKAACGEDQDCCSHFCDPASHLCGEPPQCGAVDAPCALNTDCCTGTSCVIPSGSLAGACQVSTCSFADVDCSADGQCCSGRCDRASFFCVGACLHEGTACVNGGDCCTGTCTDGVCAGICSKTSCQVAADCCSKSCIDNVCAASCEQPAAIHTPCTVGGPLGSTPANAACIDVVCQMDGYCCCTAWDEMCVTAANMQMACPALCD